MRRHQYVCAGLAVVALLLALPPAAGAQSFQGGLRGAVKDAQGVIPASPSR